MGMDMLSDEHDLPTDRRGKRVACVDALNGVFSREGHFASRPGVRRLGSARVHSFGPDLCVANGALCRVDAAGTLTPIHTLAADLPVSYAQVNGETVFSNLAEIAVLGASGLRPLATPTPAQPKAIADSAGGLFAGRYGVAMSIVANGQESAVGPAIFVEVPEGGGILVENIPTGARLYRTAHNGTEFYRAQDFPSGASVALLGKQHPGKAADTRHLDPLPPGEFVRYWRGRLVTARGRTLYMSEPMRYGLRCRRTGFVQLPGKVRWFEPVEGGIFVGQPDGVVFLRGSAPKDLQLERTGARPPVYGASTTIAPDLLGFEERPAGDCAVWLSEHGFTMGLPSGHVIAPQAPRIRLSASRGEIAVHDRRLIAFVI